MAPIISAKPQSTAQAAIDMDDPVPNLEEASTDLAPQSSLSQWKDAFIARLPLFYVFLSGLGFSIQSLIVKLLREWYGLDASFQCVFARGIAQLVISGIIILLDADRRAGHGPKLFGNTPFVRCMLFMRAFFGYFGIAFSFVAIEYMSIGDSTVLVMLSPVVAALAGFIILGEPWQLTEFIATVLALTGCVLVAKPPFLFGDSYSSDVSSSDTGSSGSSSPSHDGLYFVGVLYSLIAAGGAGMAYVFVRILGTSAKMPWANVIFSQAIAQIVLTYPCLRLLHRHFVWYGLPAPVYLLVLTGAFVGCASQIAMTVGMQREKSATASAMRTSDVVFGFCWQVLFTTDGISGWSVLGAMLVAVGIVIIVVGKSSAEEGKAKEVGEDRGVEMMVVGKLQTDIEASDDGERREQAAVRYTRLATAEEMGERDGEH